MRRAGGSTMSADPRAVLEIRNGSFAGARHELDSGDTLIGRNPTTDLTLLDEGISREHAVVLFDDAVGGYSIEDLQSTNGTKLNGKRVRSAPLAHGDTIEIGHTELRFLLEPPPEA